jgi:hypothetical protein
MTARKKVSEEIAKLRASERAATKREAKRIEEQNRAHVLQMLQNSRISFEPKVTAISDKNLDSNQVRNAICYALSQRAQKVITSFGVNPRVNVSVMDNRWATREESKISAKTDYKDIEVYVNVDQISVTDVAKTATSLMSVKGAIYHEAGHILCTMPFNALFDCLLLERGWYPLSVSRRYSDTQEEYIKAIIEAFPAYESEINNGLVYCVSADDMTPEEKKYAERVSEKDKPKFMSNWQEGVHSTKLRAMRDDLKHAWGILEDGRMEDQMSRSNPVMEDYFKTMTLNYLVSSEMPGYSWPGVVTRTHLGEEIIDKVRDLAYEYVEIHGMRRSLVDDIESQIKVYRQSKTINDVISASTAMAKLLEEWKPNQEEYAEDAGGQSKNNPLMNHSEGNRQGAYGYGSEQQTIVNEKPDIGDESKGWENSDDNQEQTQGEGEQNGNDTGQTNSPNSTVTVKRKGDSNGEGSESNQADGEKSDKQSNVGGSSGTGGVVKHNVNYEELRQQLKDMSKKQNANLASENEAIQFLADVNKELKMEVPHNSATTPMSTEVLARAKEVENGMLNALEPLAVTPDPSWRFRQEDGILDPTTYRTKEPGDTDYWINYEGEGAHGHNLSVSVLLDTSSSMQEWMDELSAGAYGIRKACEALQIPCTVSTFDTQGYLLWDSEEDAQPVQIHDGGGTNPSESLQQLKYQNAGKQKHLIVVLTDGHWSGVQSVIPFIEPHQHWVLIGLSGSEEYALSLVEKKGGNSAIGITNVTELPKQIELALTRFLA